MLEAQVFIFLNHHNFNELVAFGPCAEFQIEPTSEVNF